MKNFEKLELFISSLRVQTIELVQYLNKCRDKVVEYTKEDGARCPVFCCGHRKCKVVKPYPPTGGVRLRKHRCSVCGMEFRSRQALKS